MKKIYLISILGLLVSACSYTILIPTTPTSRVPTALPTDTIFVTSTLTPSTTPTLPTPTFTGTPTFINSGPTPTPSDTPQPTGTFGLLATEQATASFLLQPTSESPVFDNIMISDNQLVWGTSCKTNSIKVSVHIANGYDVTQVTLFTRLRDQVTGDTTDWNDGAVMDASGNGAFTYQLSADVIKYYKDFTTAWVQYQFVATNAKHHVVGRTQIYLNNISITRCH